MALELNDAGCCYAECHLCWMSFMPSATNKPFMLSVIVMNVIKMSVVILIVVAPQKWLNSQLQKRNLMGRFSHGIQIWPTLLDGRCSWTWLRRLRSLLRVSSVDVHSAWKSIQALSIPPKGIASYILKLLRKSNLTYLQIFRQRLCQWFNKLKDLVRERETFSRKLFIDLLLLKNKQTSIGRTLRAWCRPWGNLHKNTGALGPKPEPGVPRGCACVASFWVHFQGYGRSRPLDNCRAHVLEDQLTAIPA